MNNNIEVPKNQLTEEEEASRLLNLDTAIRINRSVFVLTGMVSVATGILCVVNFLHQRLNADQTVLPTEIIFSILEMASVVSLVGITATALMYFLEALAQRYCTSK